MTQWAKAPIWSPAGPQELPLGRGAASQGPAVPWGLPEIPGTGHMQEGGGRSSRAHLLAALPLRAPGPGWAAGGTGSGSEGVWL